MEQQHPDEAVYGLLRRVASGEVVPQLKVPSRGWEHGDHGNVEFLVDGWTVVAFNDGGGFDYVDSLISPDGITFDQWPAHPAGGRSSWDTMIDLWDRRQRDQLVDAFKAAGKTTSHVG